MKPIIETYRGHQIEIEDESFAIAGLEMGTLSPKFGLKAVIKIDGDDVTAKCDSTASDRGPEALLASARKHIDETFFAGQ